MSEERTTSTASADNGYRRRDLLAAAGAAGTALLAGCSGSGSTATPTPTPTPASTGGCPSGSPSYTRHELTPTGGGPAVSVVYPQASYVRGAVVREEMISVSIGDGPVLGIKAAHRPDRTIDAAVQEISESKSTIVTDEYDVPSGAVVFSSGTAAAGGMTVLLPLSKGFVEVPITVGSADSWCPEVVSAIERHVVEATRLA